MLVIAIGLADQLEFELGEAPLHAGDQRVDAVMAVAARQGIDVARIGRPVLAEQFAPTARRALVPEIDVAAGEGDVVGNDGFLRNAPDGSAVADYRRLARQSITSEVMRMIRTRGATFVQSAKRFPDEIMRKQGTEVR